MIDCGKQQISDYQIYMLHSDLVRVHLVCPKQQFQNEEMSMESEIVLFYSIGKLLLYFSNRVQWQCSTI